MNTAFLASISIFTMGDAEARAKARFKDGLEANRAGKFADAERLFVEAEKLYPPANANDRAKCLVSAGNMAKKMGNNAAAREKYQRVLSMDKLSADVHSTCKTKLDELDKLKAPPVVAGRSLPTFPIAGPPSQEVGAKIAGNFVRKKTDAVSPTARDAGTSVANLFAGKKKPAENDVGESPEERQAAEAAAAAKAAQEAAAKKAAESERRAKEIAQEKAALQAQVDADKRKKEAENAEKERRREKERAEKTERELEVAKRELAKKKAEDEAREKERRAQAEATKAKLAQVLKQSEDSGKAASASAAERERRATAEKKEQADKIQEQYAHGLI